MILSKIKKHFSLFLIRLKQNRTLQQMYSENDNSLRIIIQAFNSLKTHSFESEDIIVFSNRNQYRKSLLINNKPITYSIFKSNKVMLVKDIYKKAASSSIWCQFLYLITKEIESPFVLEIGTNLGVSGGYFLEALKDKKNSYFVTMEGLKELCDIASNEFKNITNNQKYKIHQGLYESTFPKLLEDSIDFNIIFLDGNHSEKATIYYFDTLKSKLIKPTIIILDDINWSQEMKNAWRIIKGDEMVSYSIDFHKIGIIIINKEMARSSSHYSLHLSY